jgi:hypothetical protein
MGPGRRYLAPGADYGVDPPGTRPGRARQSGPVESCTARWRCRKVINHTSLIEVLRQPVESAQYTSAAFARFCQARGIRTSVGRTGICYDNAAADYIEVF